MENKTIALLKRLDSVSEGIYSAWLRVENQKEEIARDAGLSDEYLKKNGIFVR